MIALPTRSTRVKRNSRTGRPFLCPRPRVSPAGWSRSAGRLWSPSPACFGAVSDTASSPRSISCHHERPRSSLREAGRSRESRTSSPARAQSPYPAARAREAAPSCPHGLARSGCARPRRHRYGFRRLYRHHAPGQGRAAGRDSHGASCPHQRRHLLATGGVLLIGQLRGWWRRLAIPAASPRVPVSAGPAPRRGVRNKRAADADRLDDAECCPVLRAQRCWSLPRCWQVTAAACCSTTTAVTGGAVVTRWTSGGGRVGSDSQRSPSRDSSSATFVYSKSSSASRCGLKCPRS